MSSEDRWGLTRAGLGFCALGIGVGVAAAFTRDPLLGCILWGQLTTLTAAATLSRRNLVGLRAHRRLPEELFADIPAGGGLLLINPHPRPVHQVTVQEVAAATSARFERISGHGTDGRQVRWHFARRGRRALVGLTLRSHYPFGLIFRERTLLQPASLVIYPHPEGREGARMLDSRGERDDATTRGIGGGDFQGLREYTAGDPVRLLHWPTTARTGRPMVVVTGARTTHAVIIEVAEGRGVDWERALCAAASSILRHFSAKDAVGLQIGSELLPARAGGGWRRVLLEKLALAERRSP